MTPAASTGTQSGSRGEHSVVIIDHPNVHHVVQGVAARLKMQGMRVSVLAAADAPDMPVDCDVLLTCSAFDCTAQVMDRLPRLRGIAALAIGTETIDIAAATSRGIPVAHSPTPENVISMAEASIMLILASLYRLEESQGRFRGGWLRPDTPYARTLHGKTVGLIGFGKIARAVAHRLEAWNVRMLVYSPHAPAETLPSYAQAVGLATLAQESDVISVHAAVSQANQGLINDEFLEQLKPGAVLVNTARGALVDEDALLRQAVQGKPAFMALDCFRQEPLPPDSRLREMPNSILTPHLVGHTVEVQQSLVEQGVKNVLAILQRSTPEFVRNPEVIDQWIRAR